MCDYRQLLRDMIQELSDQSLLLFCRVTQVWLYCDNLPLQVVWSFDGALGFKGQKLVSFSFRVVPTPLAVNSLQTLKQFLLYEGSDSNAALHFHLGDVLMGLNSFFLEKQIAFGSQLEEKATLSHSLVADAAGLRDNFCLNGGCPFCECPKGKLFEKGTWTERNLERIALLAHVTPGTCLGCGVDVVTPEQYAAEIADANANFRKPKDMFLVAEEGDDVPSAYHALLKKRGLQGSWLQIHHCVKYAHTVVLKLQPRDCYACVLHGDMRIMGMLADACLWKSLSRFHTRAGLNKETTCEKIYNLMRAVGIQVNKVTPSDKKVGVWYHSLSKHSFSGRECESLVGVISTVLDLVFPEQLRQQDDDLKGAYDRWSELWKYYIQDIRNLVNSRPELNPGGSGTDHTSSCEAARSDVAFCYQKAQALEEKMPRFMHMELYLGCYQATSHLYPHIYMCHLPDQLRSLRVDPIDVQMQSVEHNNKRNKTIQARTTNSLKQHEQKQEVRSHERNGKQIAGYTKLGGPCRTVQILKKSVARAVLGEQPIREKN